MQNDLNKTRIKNFEESKLDPFQNKYGLFSFAGTLAILPHSYEQSKSPKRDKDGTVKTGPRNISASPSKSGKTPDCFFSIPSFISIGDQYKDPKLLKQDKSKPDKFSFTHDAPFKLPGPFELKSNFEHKSELVPHKRTQSSAPRGFYTSPAKKGVPNCTPGLTFSQFEHVSKPPNIKLNKISRDCEKFKPTSNSPDLFDRNIYTYEGVLPIKPVKKVKKVIEVPFKPSSPNKSTFPEALFGVCEYLPQRCVTPKTGKKKAETPVPWKVTTRELTTPTVPTATMPCNLRKEFRIIH